MDALAGLGAVGAIFVLILAVLTIMMPFMIYACQKYAYKCFLELKKNNEKLDHLIRQGATKEGSALNQKIKERSQDPHSIFNE